MSHTVESSRCRRARRVVDRDLDVVNLRRIGHRWHERALAVDVPAVGLRDTVGVIGLGDWTTARRIRHRRCWRRRNRRRLVWVSPELIANRAVDHDVQLEVMCAPSPAGRIYKSARADPFFCNLRQLLRLGPPRRRRCDAPRGLARVVPSSKPSARHVGRTRPDT